MSSQKRITEAEVRKAVRRSLKKLMKEIDNEPTLVIGSDNKGGNLSDETITDIRKWLFDREVRP